MILLVQDLFNDNANEKIGDSYTEPQTRMPQRKFGGSIPRENVEDRRGSSSIKLVAVRCLLFRGYPSILILYLQIRIILLHLKDIKWFVVFFLSFIFFLFLYSKCISKSCVRLFTGGKTVSDNMFVLIFLSVCFVFIWCFICFAVLPLFALFFALFFMIAP